MMKYRKGYIKNKNKIEVRENIENQFRRKGEQNRKKDKKWKISHIEISKKKPRHQ